MVTQSHLRLEVDPSGIALVTLDAAQARNNTLGAELVDELQVAAERVRTDAGIRAAIITSAKTSFLVGADLKEIFAAMSEGWTVSDAFEFSRRVSQIFRYIETCGKPVVAAINGSAIGGGLELCLACHWRIAADERKTVLGFPEVKFGLLPGAGGTQRLPRIVGIGKALPLLLEGRQVSAKEASALKLVDELVPTSDLITRAKERIAAGIRSAAPWDVKGFGIPGGTVHGDRAVTQAFTLENARARHASPGESPARRAILAAIYEGSSLPIDRALRTESEYFAQLATSPICKSLIKTLFIEKSNAEKLIARPQGITPRPVRSLGIVGAGMMGAGIAQVAAQHGIRVTLLDLTVEGAERTRDVIRKRLQAKASNSRSELESNDVMDRISCAADYGAVSQCDLIIEAVVENETVKAEVIRTVCRAMRPEALLASNTSSIPISLLAASSRQPDRFIGLHFFSPVDRMALVEVIRGRETSNEAVALALDFTAQLRKTPIVVKDSPAFFTSRVFLSYCFEGQRMLAEGVQPALIENTSRQIGMPVGPLAVTDEVSLELQWNLVKAQQRIASPRHDLPDFSGVLERMVVGCKRPGRRAGAGFYDYLPDRKKELWPGLAIQYPIADHQPESEEVGRRLLYAQSLQAARCREEEVIASDADGDLGSILGVGFPAWTGGALSLIGTVGAKTFLRECDDLADRHGDRFRPSSWIREWVLAKA